MPFRKGKDWNGNISGRPTGSYSIYKKLEQAISLVEKEKQIDVYKHFVERALESDTILTALFRKLIPDRQQVEGDVARIINIINGYRNSNKPYDGSLREETERRTIPATTDTTESS